MLFSRLYLNDINKEFTTINKEDKKKQSIRKTRKHINKEVKEDKKSK